MLAVVYHGPQDLRLEEIKIPIPVPGEILIKVEAACICGTDLRIYQGSHRKFPPGTVRIPGHEVAGRITKLGKGVKGYLEGQPVFIAPNWGCGHCWQCVRGKNNLCATYDAIGVTVNGAFAEYLLIPAPAVDQGNVITLTSNVDFVHAALIEPLACVLHGQDALDIEPGETVLIMGAGPIGILHIKLARFRGAAKVFVSEPEPNRLNKALQMGADNGINPLTHNMAAFINEETQGNGVDIIIVAAPIHSAMEQAVHLARIGGRINLFGGLPKDNPMIQIDTNQVHYKELRVTGTTACSTADCQRAADLVNAKLIPLGDLVDQRFPLSQANKAFQVAGDRQALKVALIPSDDQKKEL
jgi:L-iditol 2-dehydrogenase